MSKWVLPAPGERRFDVRVRRDGVVLSVVLAEGPERVSFAAGLPDGAGGFRRVLLASEVGGQEAIARAMEEIDRRWEPPGWFRDPEDDEVEQASSGGQFEAKFFQRRPDKQYTSVVESDGSREETFSLETDSYPYVKADRLCVVELRADVIGDGSVEISPFRIGGGIDLLYSPWTIFRQSSNVTIPWNKRKLPTEVQRTLRAFPEFAPGNNCQATVTLRGRISASFSVVLREVFDQPKPNVADVLEQMISSGGGSTHTPSHASFPIPRPSFGPTGTASWPSPLVIPSAPLTPPLTGPRGCEELDCIREQGHAGPHSGTMVDLP